MLALGPMVQILERGKGRGGSSTSTLWSRIGPPCPFSPAMLSSPMGKLRLKSAEAL